MRESGWYGCSAVVIGGAFKVRRGEDLLPTIYRNCGSDLVDGEEKKQLPDRPNGGDGGRLDARSATLAEELWRYSNAHYLTSKALSPM